MKYKVLIVDDETAAIDMLKYYCGQYFSKELEVVGFARGIDEAFRKIKEFQPELVFLDMRMPRGYGNELLDRFPKRNFEVIVVTAGLSTVSFKSHEVLAMLGKPLDEQEFVDAVSLFLGKMKVKYHS